MFHITSRQMTLPLAGFMNIRSKLLLLIGILVVAFAVAGFTYFFLRSKAREIRSEQAELNGLRTALLNEGFQANGLASGELQDQLPVFRQALGRTDGAFKSVRGLEVLPRLSPLTASALVSIEELQQLLDGETESLVVSVKDVQEEGRSFYAGKRDGHYTVFQLLADEQLHRSPLLTTTFHRVQSLTNEIGTLAGDFTAAIAVIDNQDSVIVGETQRLASRGNALALAIIVVLLAGTALLALLLANQIAQSVKSIERDIEQMRYGDLTRSFKAMTRDEIGRLARNLNEFVISLKGSIRNVQAVSAENVRMKESLIVTTGQTSASTTQIIANSESIDRQISSLDADLTNSSSAVRSIGESIRTLDEQIREQMAMVEESTASVTEMITSIDHITKTADKRRHATERLVSTVSLGGEKMQATFEVIGDIHENVGSINDITTIIEDLSAQTSLLAMNAAIEAAHAGDAGRGFSVVADEIRKLAQASSTNSQKIGRIVHAIVDRISEASSAGTEMHRSFGEIESEAKGLSSSLAEIFSSMEELRAGGSQILQAMTVLRDTSTNVKTGSTAINESSSAIAATMAAVEQVSEQVRGGMKEIADGIHEISSAVGNVLSIAGRLGELGESLNSELVKFKTT